MLYKVSKDIIFIFSSGFLLIVFEYKKHRSSTNKNSASIPGVYSIIIFPFFFGKGLYDRLGEAAHGGFFQGFMNQFNHHRWHGLHFWDLIQPGFMFIAGTALAYSLHKQQEAGVPWLQSFVKVLKRSGWLLFWGVLIYAVHPEGLYFMLWNVLAQLAFTTLVAFLIFNWPSLWQVAFSLALLVLTEVMYRFINVPGFDQPFKDQHNIGNFIDLILMNKMNSSGWVAINCIPTACHTI